jgi:uncharacterized membrane protein
MKELVPVGILVIFVGMFLVFLGFLSSINSADSKTKVAVGGFIGFIPFGFANDKKLLYLVIGFTAIIAAVWFFVSLKIRHP